LDLIQTEEIGGGAFLLLGNVTGFDAYKSEKVEKIKGGTQAIIANIAELKKKNNSIVQ
jgi:hypothetical protein